MIPAELKKNDGTNALYSTPFDKGFFMMWQLPQDSTGSYVSDIQAARDYFVNKYGRSARQVAFSEPVPTDLEVVQIAVPTGQVWLR